MVIYLKDPVVRKREGRREGERERERKKERERERERKEVGKGRGRENGVYMRGNELMNDNPFD